MISSHFADLGLDFLGDELAQDVQASLEEGLAAGAVFEDRGGPEDLFRAAVRQAIRAIEAKDRTALLPRFLSVGPYVDGGPIPADQADRYMSDAEAAAAIRFIFSSAINSFQGQLAELLAVRAVGRLAHAAAPRARLFVGDSVFAYQLHRRAWAKAADLHLLEIAEDAAVTLHGVVEVKSFAAAPEALRPQLDRHLARAQRGLRIQLREIGRERIRLESDPPVRITVVPSTWKLSRRFWFERKGDHSFLNVEPASPPTAEDRSEPLAANHWHVTLRWSDEALADAAYAMTFWYMGELGRLLYEQTGVPREWTEMTPEQAGQNAVTMMLYYAILRARTARERSRAVALYNSYGFGYALGSSFVDRKGRREMLWPDDLHEILATGRSRVAPPKDGEPANPCHLRGFESDPAPHDAGESRA